jgi:hypothetical protein
MTVKTPMALNPRDFRAFKSFRRALRKRGMYIAYDQNPNGIKPY